MREPTEAEAEDFRLACALTAALLNDAHDPRNVIGTLIANLMLAEKTTPADLIKLANALEEDMKRDKTEIVKMLTKVGVFPATH